MLRRLLIAANSAAPPAGIEIRDTVSYLNGSGATTHNITLPAYQPGDMLVLFVSTRTTSGVSSQTTPTGWTSQQGSSINPASFRSYTRVATGSEGATVAMSMSSSDGMAAICTSIKAGTYSLSHIDSAVYQIVGNNNRDAPPIAALPWPGRRALILAACGSNGSAMPTVWPFIAGRLHAATPAGSAFLTRAMLCSAVQSTGAAYDGPWTFAANANLITISVAIGEATWMSDKTLQATFGMDDQSIETGDLP